MASIRFSGLPKRKRESVRGSSSSKGQSSTKRSRAATGATKSCLARITPCETFEEARRGELPVNPTGYATCNYHHATCLLREPQHGVLGQTCSDEARSVCGRHLAVSHPMPNAVFLDWAECSSQRGVRSPGSRVHTSPCRREPSRSEPQSRGSHGPRGHSATAHTWPQKGGSLRSRSTTAPSKKLATRAGVNCKAEAGCAAQENFVLGPAPC